MMNEKYGSSRLNSLLESGKVDSSRLQMLDCYNQTVYEEVACTITTRVITCNHYYISEPMNIQKKESEAVIWRAGLGRTSPVRPYVPDMCPTITTSAWKDNNYLLEPMPDYEYKMMPNGNKRAYSPRRGDDKGENGYHITNPNNIHPTLTSAHEPLIMEQTDNTDKVMQVGNILSSDNFDNPQRGRIFDTEGVSPTLDTAMGGDRQPEIIERVGDRDKEGYSVSDTAFTIPANPMSDRQQMGVEPFNDQDGLCRTIKAQHISVSHLTRKDSFGSTGVMEITTEPQSLTRERTEEEKERRHVEGDKGAKFSQAKQYTTLKDGVANTLTTCEKERMILEPQAMGHYRPEGRTSENVPYNEYVLHPKNDGIADTITATAGNRERMIAEPLNVRQATKQGYIECPPGGLFDASYPDSKLRRGRVQDNGTVAPTIMASNQSICLYEGIDREEVERTAEDLRDYVQQHRPQMDISVDISSDGHLRPHTANEANFGIMDYYTDHEQGTAGTQIATRPSAVYGTTTKYRIRRLTPRECFRLMDVDEWAIDRILLAKDEKGKRVISNSQAYKQAGNSIVCACLVQIFKKMFIDTAPTKPYQMSLFD